jgi:hypothetical protein
MPNDDMTHAVTRGELREELAQLEQRIDAAVNAGIARAMEKVFAELASHINSMLEMIVIPQLRTVDDQYKALPPRVAALEASDVPQRVAQLEAAELPARVAKLEAARLPPKRKRRG